MSHFTSYVCVYCWDELWDDLAWPKRQDTAWCLAFDSLTLSRVMKLLLRKSNIVACRLSNSSMLNHGQAKDVHTLSRVVVFDRVYVSGCWLGEVETRSHTQASSPPSKSSLKSYVVHHLCIYVVPLSR